MKNTSLGGAKYFVTFVDDKTRYTWTYFLKTRTKSSQVLGMEGFGGEIFRSQVKTSMDRQWWGVYV